MPERSGVVLLPPSRWWVDAPPPSSKGLAIGRWVTKMLARRWDVQVFGRENVPLTGPVILASNHMAMLDGPVMMAASPRAFHALVKSEVFVGVERHFFHATGQIPVDRRRVDRAAVRSALAVLSAGRAVAIYPEGRRGLGDLAKVQQGVGYLALCTGAPVVPVACLGTREGTVDKRIVPTKGQQMAVGFGEPLFFETMNWPRTRSAVSAATARITDALRANLAGLRAQTGIELPPDLP
jgi:1-acyl-sn-glycerol-3-phosphate acyltransferase